MLCGGVLVGVYIQFRQGWVCVSDEVIMECVLCIALAVNLPYK